MQRPPDPQLVLFLERYDPQVAEVTLAVREMLLEEAPDALEEIYLWPKMLEIWYGFRGTMNNKMGTMTKTNDWFGHLSPHTAHVNLGFLRGAALPDPEGVLKGAGKNMRHISFASLADLRRPFVRRYVRMGMEQVAQPGTVGMGRSVVHSKKAKNTSREG